MKLLALWSSLADYSVASLKCLALSYEVDLFLVYQSPHNNAPYKDLDLSFCRQVMLYKEEERDKIEMACLEYLPDVIIMSSWNYPFYMSIAKKCKQKNAYVFSTFDRQWTGTIKQYLGILSSKFFLKPVIDNFFVSGDRQATFARKLGYPNPLQGYYSANSLNNDYSKSKNRANRFVFVGRLVKEKNIQILVDAYKDYRSSVESPWELVICGRGDLEYLCKDTEGIQLMNFVQPQELCQILLESKCLVHPSLFEPWGLVIHEAALAGLAIISSFQTGASTAFVRDGVNGFIVNPGIYEISRSMYLITKKSEAQFEEMSNASKSLGNLWTTQKWADYVYNYVCLNRKLK